MTSISSRSLRIFVAVLMAVFLTTSLGHCTDPAKAKRLKKKAVLKGKLSSVQNQIHNVKVKIHETRKIQRTVIGQLSATEQELDKTQSQLASNTIRLSNAKSDLVLTTRRLERTKRQLARRKNLLERRIVDIYEGDDLGYINVIIGSKNMWSFLTRAEYFRHIIRNDNELIDQIKSDKRQIERDRLRQKRRVSEIEDIQSDLVQQKMQVASLVLDKRQQLNKIENNRELYEKALDELEATSRQIEDSIRKMQSSPAGRARMARAFKGGLSLPVSGRITSRFGYRVHPVTGVYKLHTGVDISCHSGTPVHAAADGTVILSGWYGAYGNAIVIDHGGGVSTLYGHCSRLMARRGQTVKRGEVIARSGSTGFSTGPHCHFEKRVNGTPVNPL